jgi:hypothetical protein
MRSILRRLRAGLRRATALDSLRICPVCHGHFVCPMSWGPSDDLHWHLVMRCGDCGWRYEETVTNARAAEYDRELDYDQATIRRVVSRLDRERMAAEVELFVTALGQDLIDAGDFAPH